jgi:cell shape-determining protein MreD
VRTATIVLVAYFLCVVVAAVWRFMPGFTRDAIPVIGALTAAYLGHTARPHILPVTVGVAVLGYLIDVISGTPAGMTSIVLVITSDVARRTQRRLFVRGTLMVIGFSAFISIIASLSQLVVRAISNVSHMQSAALELQQIALVAFSTSLMGPLVWRLYRRIDASFARTHRERDAALEGLAP